MPIPRIVHQTWKTDTVPEHWKASQEAWKALGYEYHLWTDADNRAFIAEHYDWFLGIYDAFPHPIQRADTVRYFLLDHYGGIYSDLDLVPTEFFKGLFEGTYQHLDDVVLTETRMNEANEPFTNSLMMSPKGAPFWKHVWTAVLTRVDKRKGQFKHLLAEHFHYFHVLFSTGPGVINDAVRAYGKPVHTLAASHVAPEHKPKASGVIRLTAPDNTKHPRVAAIETLRGSSWHRKRDQVWLNLHAFWKLRDYYFIPLAAVGIVSLVIFFVMLSMFIRGRLLPPVRI